MRTLWVTGLVVLLSGCLGGSGSGSPNLDEADAEAPSSLDGPMELASATLAWHQDDLLEPYHIATQPVANPCLYTDDDGTTEPYFNNLHVSDATAVSALPAGTAGLEVTLDWSDEDYVGDALALAYEEEDGWHVSAYLPKGTSIVDVDDVAKRTHMDLWLCVWGQDEDGSLNGLEPRFFAGEVTLTLHAVGTV